jgi:hypothetical protein
MDKNIAIWVKGYLGELFCWVKFYPQRNITATSITRIKSLGQYIITDMPAIYSKAGQEGWEAESAYEI